jgi:NADPH:quinone reductase-like Zn-dependent oxidoreductase
MKRRYKILTGLLGIGTLGLVGLAIALSYDASCPTPSASPAGGMRAITRHCYGDTGVLTEEIVARPTLADDGVLVKVHVAAVNPLDKHYLHGKPYIMRFSSGIGAPENPRMGVDFAGVVEEVGKNVTRFKPGDAVFGGVNGAFAEYVSLRESRAIALIPANADFEQAAALPIAAVTALQALRDKGQVQRGERVLVNGASGGVGTYAVQIAKILGAEVTGVCSARNVALVQSLGADHVIDYAARDFTSDGTRYDVIIDTIGNHSLSALRGALAQDGRLVMVGGAPGNWLGALTQPLKAMLLQPFVDQRLKRIFAELNADDLRQLATWMQDGSLRSVIDRRYRLEQVKDAIAYLETGRARGKILLTVAD